MLMEQSQNIFSKVKKRTFYCIISNLSHVKTLVFKEIKLKRIYQFLKDKKELFKSVQNIYLEKTKTLEDAVYCVLKIFYVYKMKRNYRLAIGTWSKIIICSMDLSHVYWEISGHCKNQNAFDFISTEDGPLLLTITISMKIVIWNIETKQLFCELAIYNPLSSIKFINERYFFVTYDFHGTQTYLDFFSLDLETKKISSKSRLNANVNSVTSFIYIPETSELILGSDFGLVSHYKLIDETHKSLYLNYFKNKVTCMAYECLDSNTNIVAVGKSNSEISVFYSFPNYQNITTLNGHKKEVTSVKFFSDINGRKIISSSGDRTIRIWKCEGTFWSCVRLYDFSIYITCFITIEEFLYTTLVIASMEKCCKLLQLK